MEQTFVKEQKFEKIDFNLNPLPKGEYENCTFLNCDFSNADLSDNDFVECKFVSCNLSMTKLVQTAFKDIEFKDCKMLGLRCENCTEFGLSFSFDNCILNHSSFYRTKIRKTVFKNSQLHETDLSGCDLTGAIFDNCDLAGSTFDNTIIEKADFRTSYNYSIDPEVNRVKKCKFSLLGIAGLLNKYDIEIELTKFTNDNF